MKSKNVEEEWKEEIKKRIEKENKQRDGKK